RQCHHRHQRPRPFKLSSSNSTERPRDTRTTSAPDAQRDGVFELSHQRWPQQHSAVTTRLHHTRFQGQQCVNPSTDSKLSPPLTLTALTQTTEIPESSSLNNNHLLARIPLTAVRTSSVCTRQV